MQEVTQVYIDIRMAFTLHFLHLDHINITYPSDWLQVVRLGQQVTGCLHGYKLSKVNVH